MPDAYPGNSRESTRKQVDRPAAPPPSAPKEEQTTRRKVPKVVTGRVVEKKRSLGSRFKETFFSGGKEVGEYVLHEVIIPSVKEVFIDAVTQFIERGLWRPDQERGGYRARTGRPYTHRPSGRSGYIQYGGGSSSSRNRYEREDRSRDDRPSYNIRQERNGFRLKEVVFRTHLEADNVLRELEYQAKEYGHASVIDYYDAIDLTHEYTDESWGWYGNTLEHAHIQRLGVNEFILNLPSPERLDR